VKSAVAKVAPIGGSFRDPAGFVFRYGGRLYRQVNKAGKADFDFFIASGLYAKLAGEGLIVTHEEVKLTDLPPDPRRYKVLKPVLIPFVSYPYEWGFSQTKAAALLTLRIQKIALEQGMILKDASAYNVQFFGRRPLFIDSLSFRIYKPGAPWDGYRQFCEHFVAPLAVAAYGQLEVFKILRAHLDGLPLATVVRMLPAKARLRRGLAAHIYLHAASARRYDSGKTGSVKIRLMSKLAMDGLLASLQKTVRKLQAPKQVTQWSDYYSGTNYSDRAFKAKKEIVEQMLSAIDPRPRVVWDLGANDGRFSELAARRASYVVSVEADPRAAELNFTKPRDRVLADLILPLSQDLANPSPALGWAHQERHSLLERGPADAVLVLALLHHLVIGNNLPLAAIAEFLASIGRFAIVEFVPKSDSNAQILLRGRINMFDDYTRSNFEKDFARCFTIVERAPIRESQRTVYLLKAKARKQSDGPKTAK